MQETQVWALGREDPLELEMATHSNILAWKISWTQEADGLQFMGSQKELDTTEWLKQKQQSSLTGIFIRRGTLGTQRHPEAPVWSKKTMWVHSKKAAI